MRPVRINAKLGARVHRVSYDSLQYRAILQCRYKRYLRGRQMPKIFISSLSTLEELKAAAFYRARYR